MKTLGVLALIAIGSIVTSLIQSAVLSKIWTWFVAFEYGPGPSMGSWFGISTILGLIVSMVLSSMISDDNNDKPLGEVIKKMIARWVGLWLGCACLLGICWITGSILGWMH